MTATNAVVEGPTRRAERSEHWRQLGELLTARYMADEQGQAYAQLTAERPSFLVEITPLQITSWRGARGTAATTFPSRRSRRRRLL
ncbi:MAG TPA: hypothetical protein VF909_18810 [Roseiflexaceae bacterium]